MKLRFLVILSIFVLLFCAWLLFVLFPFGGNVLIHIQNVVNNGLALDLFYCAKQFLYIVLLSIVIWILTIIIFYIIN